MEENIKIIFWGTAEFALPPLNALLEHGYNIVAVVTNPDEPAGRKRMITPPPIKVFAQKHNIPVLQPETLAHSKFQILDSKPDLFVVAAYGKIIPKEILEIPRYGALNIHPSLLPRWRGPSPIQATILSGDAAAGVTIIQMDEKMDHGPVLESRKWKVKEGITAPELSRQLAELGAELLIEVLPKWIRGEITPAPQDETQATYCALLKKESGRIDWRQSAAAIDRAVRAFTPWPGSFTFWKWGGRVLRLKIIAAAPIAAHQPDVAPGCVSWNAKGGMSVQTGNGSMRVLRIQPEGKEVMTAREFMNGHPNVAGSVLG